MLEYKLPKFDQPQICLSRYESGRANIIHLAYSRVEGDLQEVTVLTAFYATLEDGSVSRVGRNPAPIKRGTWRKNILLVSHIFCISFVLVAKDPWTAMGTFEWCFQILLPKARCLAPILEPTNDIGES